MNPFRYCQHIQTFSNVIPFRKQKQSISMETDVLCIFWQFGAVQSTRSIVITLTLANPYSIYSWWDGYPFTQLARGWRLFRHFLSLPVDLQILCLINLCICYTICDVPGFMCLYHFFFLDLFVSIALSAQSSHFKAVHQVSISEWFPFLELLLYVLMLQSQHMAGNVYFFKVTVSVII